MSMDRVDVNVLKYFYKTRSIRDAYKEYENDSPIGRASLATFARRAADLESRGRLRKTAEGYVVRHPVADYGELLRAAARIFQMAGDTDPKEFSPAYWYFAHLWSEDDPKVFVQKVLEKADQVNLLATARMVEDLIERPEATVAGIRMWFDAIDPTGQERTDFWNGVAK
jgi:hypothetical protein